MDLKDYTAKCDAESDARTIREQAARLRELEGALRDMLRHYDRTDGSAPVGSKARATRDHARRVLSEGSVKA